MNKKNKILGKPVPVYVELQTHKHKYSDITNNILDQNGSQKIRKKNETNPISVFNISRQIKII
jgi:predicted patatin/cPLA2 family phospholipase